MIAIAVTAPAQPVPQTATESVTPRPLRVGTKVSPPFAMLDGSGKWTGISIEFMRALALELELGSIELIELSTENMLRGLESGQLDAAIAAISITPPRERRVDFTHPYYRTGLGIAVSADRAGGGMSLFWQQVRESRAAVIVSIVVLILITLAFVFAALEARDNPLFRDSAGRRRVELGLWWATSLMLGNKGLSPSRRSSRILAATTMFSSVLLMSILTGWIASLLTIGRLQSDIRRVGDLQRVRTVAVADSTGSESLTRRRIRHTTVASAADGLTAVASGAADALVHDQPTLKYLAHDRPDNDIRVLSLMFDPQDYSIALPRDSPLRKPLNEKLLELRDEDWWRGVLFRYLGE